MKSPVLMRSAGARSRRGTGALALLALLAFAVLVVLAFSQRFREELASEYEQVSVGRKAFYLAESALNEATLDFVTSMNVPTADPASWFQRLRRPLARDYDGVEERAFVPESTQLAYDEDGVEVSSVTVAVSRQASLDGLPYDKRALLTLTATVTVPRRLPGVLGRRIVRRVERAFELRHVLVTPPRPFDGYTFYLHRWGYLARALEAWRSANQEHDQGTVRLESQINLDMEAARDGVRAVVEACQKGVEEYEDAMDKARHLPGGRSKVERTADRMAREAGFEDFDEVRRVADLDPACWLPAAGYPWHAQRVAWPPFRTEGGSLTNPVYVTQRHLGSGELELRRPPDPERPSPMPRDQIPEAGRAFIAWADWAGRLGNLAEVFSSWCSRRDATLPPFRSELDHELRRHEATFKVVTDDWLPRFTEQLEPRLGASRLKACASWVFPDHAAFGRALERDGGSTYLDGIYFVEGDLRVDLSSYQGSGMVAASGHVDVDACVNAGQGCLSLVAGGDVRVRADAVEAGLLAPRGTVRFGGATVRGLAYQAAHSGEPFTLDWDERLASLWSDLTPRLDRYWVTVSPAPLVRTVERR